MIRTRFAPSPTGYLHIGGVRTALFNWLFARRHGGRFVLRIDDTDVRRNVDEALAPILDGFTWLGLDWDEGPRVGGPHAPYFQSERKDLHVAAAEALLASGHAYYDYATTEELEAERNTARKAGERFVYSRRFRAETPGDRTRYEDEGRSGVVRLMMPREGTCRFDDLIRGEVEVAWAAEQDHVIQRADGSCLYNLATVVDDHDMEITHVIRAEEHLSNTARQIFIAQSLGYEPPTFAHLPYVAEPGSRTKLSKRKLEKYLKNQDFSRLNEHGGRIASRLGLEAAADTFNPVIVDFYREIGFLPDALVNYLLLLGWSLDDRTEFLSREEMIASFSLERVNRSPASFDPQKLMAFQEHYMQELGRDETIRRVGPFLERAGLVSDAAASAPTLAAIVDAAGDRLKVAGDILDYEELFTEGKIPYDEKAFAKRLVKPPEAGELLAGFRDRLAAATDFTTDALDQLLRDYVEERGVKIGQVIHALRVAVTGKAVGFGMFETLEILGRERSVQRIEDALARLDKEQNS